MPFINSKWWTDPVAGPGDATRTGTPFKDQNTEDIVPKMMRDFAYEIGAAHLTTIPGHIPYFATTTARDAAITAPVVDQMCVLVNKVQRWSGAAWVDTVVGGGGGGGALSTDPGNDLTLGTDTGFMFDHDSMGLAGHIHTFASLSAALSAVPTPPDGMFGWLLDTDALIVGKAGTWRWYRKTFPHQTGNAVWGGSGSGMGMNWTSTYTSASYTHLSINGRSVTLTFSGVLATPVNASSANIATLYPAAIFPVVRIDQGLSCGYSNGAGSGRVQVSVSGALAPFWTANDVPAACSSIYGCITWSIADLLAALV